MKAAKYDRRGLLAVLPESLDKVFVEPQRHAGADAEADASGVVIVDVCGPLESEPHPFWDSYPAVLARVQFAMEMSGCRAVVLRISSPGGEAHGCFDAARALRALSEQKGIPLCAYVEDRACSAAYALACAAQNIYLSASSLVGSIGVLYVREDISARNVAMGLRVEFVASGARKADGNPNNPVTSEELSSQQAIVDEMADLFFDLVRELRRGLDARALQAGVFLGSSAVRMKLADDVVSFDGLRALITSGELTMNAYEKARKALAEAAEGDDANAAAAKRALAAMDDKPAEDAEGDEEKPDAEGDEEKPDAEGDDAEPAAASAEGSDGEVDEKKDKDPPPAARKAKSGDAGATALAEVRKLTAQVAKERDARLRAEVYATRPDWSPAFIKTLAGMPIAALKDGAKNWPKQQSGVTASSALAATRAKPTVGGAPTLADGTPLNSLSARMGLGGETRGVVSSEFKLQLGAPVQTLPVPGGSNG